MEDNQGAIFIATTDSSSSRSKHFDIKLHFVREVLQRGAVKLHFCPTDKNIADLLTKAISNIKFNNLALQALGIKPTEYLITPQPSQGPQNIRSVERGVLTGKSQA
jgi:hypothetical protein